MYCVSCGKKIEEGSNTCNYCSDDSKIPIANEVNNPFLNSGQRNKIKGRLMVFIPGIIMIPGGIILLFGCVSSLVFLIELNSGYPPLPPTFNMYFDIFSRFLYSIATLVVGIFGIIYSKNPEKSSLLVKSVITLQVLCLVYMISGLMEGLYVVDTMIAFLVLSIAPIIFLIGALKLKKNELK